MKIKAFKIEISEQAQQDLRDRIHQVRWPGDLGNEQWHYGCQESFLRELLAEWKDFDWSAQQDRLNELPHYLAQSDTVKTPIHFIHVKQNKPPLLLLPGWPWSFWDFSEMIESLSQEYDVIIPDLLGFGLSSPLQDTKLGFVPTADLIHELMQTLGYQNYGVYGGDWGALVAEQLAHKYPQQISALHLSMPFPLDFAPIDPSLWSEEESEYATLTANWWQHGTAYFQMHAGKPQTVAYLGDSPAAMAAWIVEKLNEWSDHDGNVFEAYSREQMLTLLSLFWYTNTLGSSARFYAESLQNPWQPSSQAQPVITVPTGVSAYPKEVAQVPKAWVEDYFNLEYYQRMQKGGHFPPVEVPESLTQEILSFFKGRIN